jgi:antitoxin PrlF
MSELLQAKSTLTQRYQTTIPYVVRQTLRLEKGNQISYQILPDGSVILSRWKGDQNHEESDPVLVKFLDFLEEDMTKNPQEIKPMTSTIANRIKSLVGNLSVDLEAPLDDEEE